MKAVLTVKTAKGFYGPEIRVSTKGGTVKDIFAEIIDELGTLPDEIEGEKAYDWTSMTLEITK